METKFKILIAAALLILIILGVVLVLTRSEQDRGPSFTGPAQLTVWRLFEDEATFRPLIEEYKLEHPDVTIIYEKKNPADYEEVFNNALAGGKGPDVLSLPNDWLAKHRDKLVAAPADLISTQAVKDQFVPVVGEEVIFEEQVLGLPLYTDALALYYNRDLFQQAFDRLRNTNPSADWSKESALLSRPPATWDDLVAAVKLITIKDGRTVSLAGLAMGTSETAGVAPAILQALMLQNGAKMANVDRSAAAFQLPEQSQTGESFYPGTEALDFYTAFARPDRAVYSFNDALGNAVDAFATGKAAMMIHFQYAEQSLKQKAPNLVYEIAALPQIQGTPSPVNVATYMVETVTKDSKNSLAAWDLVKFLAEKSGTFRSTTRRPSPYRLESEGNTDAFPTGVRLAKSVYKPDAKKYDQIFKDMIAAVVNLNQPPQTAIDVAANKVTELLLAR